MSLGELTAPAVLAAIQEYDQLGGPQFLAKYGFGEAKRYWLIWNGKPYPSKAIAGAAHGYVPGHQPLAFTDFSGGESIVAPRLRQLGFVVEGAERNPPWNRDELILALELYMTNPAAPPGKDSVHVAGLSQLLNKMHRLAGTTGTAATLRNANGVYLKMMNLRALDPAFTAQGKVGMKSGGKLEKAIWDEYHGQPAKLASDAGKIRQAVASADESKLAKLPPPETYEGEEGGVLIGLHKRYERDAKLVAEKRKAAQLAGKLKCEVCDFDFGATYGSLGAGYIEVHHLKPVHKLKAASKTPLTDLALLCANCHRMAHRRREPLALDEIRAARSQ